MLLLAREYSEEPVEFHHSYTLHSKTEVIMPADYWVGTWACAPQLTEPENLPPAPGLSGTTLRQAVHVSIGGPRLRVWFSNAFGTGPVAMGSVHIAISKGDSRVDPGTNEALVFQDDRSATIPPGETIVSDPLEFTVPPLANLAVTIFFQNAPPAVTGHPGSRTTSYIQAGDAAAAESMPTAGAPQQTAMTAGRICWPAA
jgi:hypothetical protein